MLAFGGVCSVALVGSRRGCCACIVTGSLAGLSGMMRSTRPRSPPRRGLSGDAPSARHHRPTGHRELVGDHDCRPDSAATVGPVRCAGQGSFGDGPAGNRQAPRSATCVLQDSSNLIAMSGCGRLRSAVRTEYARKLSGRQAFLLVTALSPKDCKSIAKASKVRILHLPPRAERALDAM